MSHVLVITLNKSFNISTCIYIQFTIVRAVKCQIFYCVLFSTIHLSQDLHLQATPSRKLGYLHEIFPKLKGMDKIYYNPK